MCNNSRALPSPGICLPPEPGRGNIFTPPPHRFAILKSKSSIGDRNAKNVARVKRYPSPKRKHWNGGTAQHLN